MSLNFSEHFQGKRILVTGAGKGVGRALTIRLDQEGAIVYAVTRTQADLDSLAKETSRIIPICVDIADWDAVRTMLVTHLKERLDILVNNAAISPKSTFLGVTKEFLTNTFDINFNAVVNITQICAQNMVAHGKGGCIINISSVAGTSPFPKGSIYCASKAAIDSLTKSLSVELGRHKIRAVSLTLGEVGTSLSGRILPNDEAMTAFKEFSKSKLHLGEELIPLAEVVDRILFMASGAVHMMAGCRFVLDGGWSSS